MKKSAWFWLALMTGGILGCSQSDKGESETAVSDSPFVQPATSEMQKVDSSQAALSSVPSGPEESKSSNAKEHTKSRRRDNTRRPSEEIEEVDFFKPRYKTPQVFVINPTRDTILTCFEGTQISIKAISFIEEATGKEPTGPVSFSVEEYYKISDMLRANLSTSSNGKLLETGGMLNLGATANGQKLKLKKEAPIEILLAGSNAKKDGMQSFSGEMGKNNQINWIPEIQDIDQKSVRFYVPKSKPISLKGGYEEIAGFLSHHLSYRAKTHENVREKLAVSFVVTKKGEITGLKFVGDNHYGKIGRTMDQVFKNATMWKPGQIGNRLVDTRITVKLKVKKGRKGRLIFEGHQFETSGGHIHSSNINSIKFLEAPLKSDSVPMPGGYELGDDSTYYRFNYTLKTSNLGWINCDRFWNIDNPIVFKVSNDGYAHIRIRIVFKKRNSILEGGTADGVCHFYGVPSGEEVAIVSMAYINSKPYMAIMETRTGTELVQNLDYKPASDPSILKAMADLDSQSNR